MRGLGCSEEEAAAIAADDKAIEKGAKMEFDLPPEKLEVARKYCRADTKKRPTVYNFTKTPPKRKKSSEKVEIVQQLAQFLMQAQDLDCENVTVVNEGQEISFDVNSQGYSLKLTAHRKKKGAGA